MGNMFIIARIIDRNAVKFQNACQSHSPGKMLPIIINPPNDSYAFVLGEKISLNCLR
jgi:hypothetical protein